MLNLVPCTVTQVTPLLIQFGAETPTSGVKIAGATYSLGAALAITNSSGKPLVVPIGA